MPLKTVLMVVAAILYVSEVASQKTFTRCELASELLRQGFDRNGLSDWVCLVEAESSSRTWVIGPPNSDGSRDYGLFQINNRYWCGEGSPGGDCHVACSELIQDDITVASKCAQLIFSRMGFPAWAGWNQKCQGDKPDLSNCNL